MLTCHANYSFGKIQEEEGAIREADNDHAK